jgi:hypothetical protein
MQKMKVFGFYQDAWFHMGTFDADFEPYTQLERKGMGYKYVNLF